MARAGRSGTVLAVVAVLGVAVLGLTACASWYERPSGVEYDRYRISAEEIALEQGKVNNMHVLIERLRPHWLDVGPSMSSSSILVYEGQSLLGGSEALRGLSPDYAEWLEFLDRSQAVARLPGIGSRRIDGAIVIHRTP